MDCAIFSCEFDPVICEPGGECTSLEGSGELVLWCEAAGLGCGLILPPYSQEYNYLF